MSKNHPHDNIYNILGKLSDLDAKHAPKAKPANTAPSVIYETVEARGSLMEGVDTVQAKLTQKFAESKTNEAVRVAGNTKGPVGHYSHMKYADKDGSPEAQAHRDATAAMAKSARAAGSKLPFNKTTEPSGKLAHGGYNAMTKGVTPVKMAEETCNECGMTLEGCGCDHTNESRPTLATDKGTIYKGGTYGNAAYDDEPAATSAKPATNADGSAKRGRPRVRDPIVRKNAPGVKGRPKKATTDAGPTMNANDPFGRVSASAHKTNTVKGRKITGKASMESKSISEAIKTVERRLMEGMSFKKMAEERHQSIEEMMNQMAEELKHFKATGECSDFLRDCMEIRGHYNKMLEATPRDPWQHVDMGIPTGSVVYYRGRQGTVDRVEGSKCFVHLQNGDMDVWPTHEVGNEKQSMLSTLKKDAGDIATGLKGFFTGGPEHTMEDQELNELARLAGLTTETTKSPMADKDYDHDGQIETEKDEVHGSHRRAAGLDEGSEVDFDKVLEAIAAIYGDDIWENDAMQDLADDLMQAGPTDQELDQIIATGELPPRLANTEFTNSDDVQFGGRDQATGELDEIRRLSGITENDEEERKIQHLIRKYGWSRQEALEYYYYEKHDPKDYAGMEEGSGGMHYKAKQAELHGEKSFKMGDKEFPVEKNLDEVEEVDEPEVEPENAPDEKYFSIKASTMNPGEGDYGEKNQYGKRGDNPMTQQPSRPAKPVMSLESRLAAEYESIKKATK
jgi:hypothetical protein